MPKDQTTTVSFRDREGSSGPHKFLDGIYINGLPIRVEKGSVILNANDGEATKVTLTILPDSVHFDR